MTHVILGPGGSGGGGLITAIADTASIDLTELTGSLTADLNLSAAVASAGNLLVSNDIQADGLRSQISETSIEGIFSASAPLSYSAGNYSIPQATGSADGYLSSTDWSTFNAKQPAGNYITALTGEATASGPGSANTTLDNSAVIGKVLTGLTPAPGTIAATDSILQAFGKAVSNSLTISTTAPITGGGDLTANRTIAMPVATALADGYLSSADWSTFNAKQQAITVASPGAGTANGLALSGGSLNVHYATDTFPGSVSTTTQTFAGNKQFNGDIIRQADTTNPTFFASTISSAAPQPVLNGQTASVTCAGDSFKLTIEIENDTFLQADCHYAHTRISFPSDSSNYALLTDSGVGIYVFKSANSRTISVKNRLGTTVNMRIRILSGITSTTAWA
jgi:hypothetical protein